MEINKQEYLQRFQPRAGPVNERQAIIQEMVDCINKERVGTKYKPVTWRQINGMCGHLKGFELGWFLQEAKKAKSFGSYFFYKLKTKK